MIGVAERRFIGCIPAGVTPQHGNAGWVVCSRRLAFKAPPPGRAFAAERNLDDDSAPASSPTPADIDRCWIRREASKAFFFEKKKQKTFAPVAVSAASARPEIPKPLKQAKGPKVFLSFFPKKDCCLALPGNGSAANALSVFRSCRQSRTFAIVSIRLRSRRGALLES